MKIERRNWMERRGYSEKPKLGSTVESKDALGIEDYGQKSSLQFDR
jgi:hypothetical protein